MTTVVLLHGLGRTKFSMAQLRKHIESLGLPTWAVTYPSRTHSIEALGAYVSDAIERELAGEELAAVTHSLGGIVVRHMQRVRFERVCMLAPPNQGSRFAARVASLPAFRWFIGPAGLELAAGGDWPNAPHELAVIAGTSGAGWANPSSFAARTLGVFDPADAHDGTVSVSETHHPDMVDFATVQASHTWIMNHPRTKDMVARFLQTGRLTPPASE